MLVTSREPLSLLARPRTRAGMAGGPRGGGGEGVRGSEWCYEYQLERLGTEAAAQVRTHTPPST